MTVIALAVSVEGASPSGAARAAGTPRDPLRQPPGSIPVFFPFNAGVIALIAPVPVELPRLRIYVPVVLATLVGLSVILLTRRLPRRPGAVLVAAYLGFAVGGYLLVGGTPGAGG